MTEKQQLGRRGGDKIRCWAVANKDCYYSGTAWKEHSKISTLSFAFYLEISHMRAIKEITLLVPSTTRRNKSSLQFGIVSTEYLGSKL